MVIERKVIMVPQLRETYTAFDGTEFETEKECVDYEMRLSYMSEAVYDTTRMLLGILQNTQLESIPDTRELFKKVFYIARSFERDCGYDGAGLAREDYQEAIEAYALDELEKYFGLSSN